MNTLNKCPLHGESPRYLSEEMSDCEARAFEEHIEACVSCRVELEECAAPPEIWSLARQHLEKFRTYRPKSSVATKRS